MKVLSTKALAGQIRSIRNNSTKLREQIQQALESCAFYAVKDGNTNPFNDLLDAVGTSTRVKGITTWAELNGFVQIKDEKFIINKTARKEADVHSEEDFAVYLAEYAKLPKWYEVVKAEAKVSIFDASKYLSNVISKLESEGVADLVPYIEKAIEEYNKAQAIKDLAMKSLGEALL